MAVVAIAREIGTAGTQVGLAVARAPGCAFVDREIIVEAARRYEVAAERLVDLDERAPSFWQRFDRERRRLLVFIRAALLDRLASGACVVTGRLAPLLLRDVAPVLLVRVTAPLDVRVRRVMAETRADEAGARPTPSRTARAPPCSPACATMRSPPPCMRRSVGSGRWGRSRSRSPPKTAA